MKNNGKDIENFEFLKLSNDYFENFKVDERLRNDIVRVQFKDGSSECRMYFENKDVYAVIPDDNVMFNEISKKTWTVFTNDGTPINFIRTNRDNDNLSDVLTRYGRDDPSYIYTIRPNEYSKIDEIEYSNKRKEFIANHPFANTNNPDYERYVI